MTHALLRPRQARAADTTRFAANGDTLFHAGDAGHCWRIRQGVVRLTRAGADGEQFAGLARPGDIIGSETLAGRPHGGSAYALGRVELQRCVRLEKCALLALLGVSEQRATDALGLRIGTAEQRIQRLMCLLAQPDESGYVRIDMPSLREMSEMTDLTRETISRHISRLGQCGALMRRNRNHAYVAQHYLHPGASTAMALAA